MDNGTAFVLVVYGLAGAGAAFYWWNYGRQISEFVRVKCIRRSYSDAVTFHRVCADDADALISAHQTGNRGPTILRMRGGGKASIDTGEFISIEIG